MEIKFIADKSLCSNVGLVRKANEDNCGEAQTPNGHVFVVCDGMGGHVGGATASKIAVENILDYFRREKYPNPQKALTNALICANTQILGTARDNPELKGMGTTACILLIQGDEAYIAHVGDSRIYLYVAKEKYLHRITEDHSYVMSLVKSGELDDRDAENHPRKNVILKALGIKKELKPEVAAKPIFPAKGDIFLICSDGLSGMVDDNGLENIMQQEFPLENSVSLLIEAALNGGGKDNITAQLIQVTESRWKTAIFVDKNPKWRQKKGKIPKKKKVWIYAAAAITLLFMVIGGYLILRKPIEKSRLTKQISEINDRIIQLDTLITVAMKDTSLTKSVLDHAKTSNSFIEESQKLFEISKDTLFNREARRESLKNEKTGLEKRLKELQQSNNTKKTDKDESNNNRTRPKQ